MLIHAKQARQLATGWGKIDGKVIYDTTGEYVYKVAYDEAEEMIRMRNDEWMKNEPYTFWSRLVRF